MEKLISTLFLLLWFTFFSGLVHASETTIKRIPAREDSLTGTVKKINPLRLNKKGEDTLVFDKTTEDTLIFADDETSPPGPQTMSRGDKPAGGLHKGSAQTGIISLMLYPNPCHGSTALQITHTGQMYARVRIYSGTGQLVREMSIATDMVILSDLPSGIYTISVSDAGNEQVKRLFVK